MHLHYNEPDSSTPQVVSTSTPLPVAAGTVPSATTDDWSYAAGAGGITNTTDVAIKAAAGAGIVNVLTSAQIENTHATVATEVVIKDGSTVIWRSEFPAAMKGPVDIKFVPPLRSTSNTALNVACVTTGSKVYVNAQGYEAA